MKTVQMTLGENLIKAVDSAAKKLGTTRSAFTREALRSALKTVQVREYGIQTARRLQAQASQDAANSTTGNRNKSGVIDEEKQGPMVPVLPTRQEATGCNSY